MAKDDSAQVPIKLAATLMLLADRPKLQVLMVRRTPKVVFAGGMWVFPGGAVDQLDYGRFLPENALPALMPDNAVEKSRALCMAAIRETFEEAGILLAYSSDSKLIKNSSHVNQLNRARAFLHAKDTAAFTKLLEEAGIVFAFDQLHYLSRWVTPKGSPRRFDAYFFAARMPEHQLPEQDNSEITHYEWFDPKVALAQHQKGAMAMMTPTLGVLSACTNFQYTDDFFKALTIAGEAQAIRIEKNSKRLLFPGDVNYNAASQTIETGWIRIPPHQPVCTSSGLPNAD